MLYSLPFLLTATIYDRVDGVLVADVTPATNSFFRVGDLITHIDGCRIRSPLSVQHSYDTGRCYRDRDRDRDNVDGTSSSDHYGTYIYIDRYRHVDRHRYIHNIEYIIF